MKAIVEESHLADLSFNWQIDQKPGKLVWGILGIDDEIKVSIPSLKMPIVSQKGPKTKLSSLRGRIKRQSVEDIDEKIQKLRNEWERDF